MYSGNQLIDGKAGGCLGENLGGSTPTRSLALGRCHSMLFVPSENNKKLSSPPRVASPDQICTQARTSSDSVGIRGQGPLVQGLTFGDLKVGGELNAKKVRRKSRFLDVLRRQECRELSSENHTNFKGRIHHKIFFLGYLAKILHLYHN